MLNANYLPHLKLEVDIYIETGPILLYINGDYFNMFMSNINATNHHNILTTCPGSDGK